MKKTLLLLTAATTLGIMASCGNNQPQNAPAKKQAPTTASAAQAVILPNYRYVDLDTVLSKYNLAKDYNEEMLRMQNNMEATYKSHQNKLQHKASQIETKYKNNGYLSEASFNQDQQELNNMQNSAQNSMARLQAELEQSAMKAQSAVNDSIEAYIATYNKTHGYDAIFFKASTLYINPELDITDEIVSGLNARYNKMKK